MLRGYQIGSLDNSPEVFVKSQLNNMLEIWEAAYLDAASLCALSDTKSFRLDIERIRSSVTSRGLGFFTLDIPNLDAVLLQLLEEGAAHFQGHLCARKSKTDSRPRFLWDFWKRVCDARGCLLSQPDPDAILAIRQLSCLFKKLEVKCSDSRIEASVGEYFEIEDSIPPPSLNWDDDHLDTSRNTSFQHSFANDAPSLWDGSPREKFADTGFLSRLDRVSRILVSELGTFDSMSEDSPETGFFKHGPGAVSNLPGSGYKYLFPFWSEKLEGVFPFDWCSGSPLGSYPPSRQERPSRLFAVPKTAKGPRLIAMEPVEHQWCQQKVKTWLDHAMKSSLIGKFFDPSNQMLSQHLVAQASIDRSLSTIDLSSASDRVSCRHIEALLDSNKPLLIAAHATRTRWIEDGLTKRGFFKLRKFASMGSALTFPMQSIFFLCVALASAGASNRSDILHLVGKVRTFGDDIIIPNAAHNACVHNLNALGLKVNKSKSFSLGFFRESCGKDAWCGYDVTPLKPKVASADTSTDLVALVDTSNNFYFRGYWRTAEVYRKLLPHKMRNQVFLHTDGVPAIQSYSGRSPNITIKWCSKLHFHYASIRTVIKPNELIPQDNSFALREFLTRPFSALRPRQTGTKRLRVAKFATLRVGLTT